jgi:hypothetical protein
MVLKRFFILMLILAACTATLAGCAKTPPQMSKAQPVSCRDALSGNLQGLSPVDIALLLDTGKNDPTGCWEELIKRCLDQQIDIPIEHLALAVHRFNRHQTEAYFHKSVFRYFSAIDRDKTLYGQASRDLLVAYCRYVLTTAQSTNNPHLKNAELLTRRLDPVLHDRIFQY